MHIYKQIYEFAASAGALEGWVYHKESLDTGAPLNWVDNLVKAYKLLPTEALDEFQSSIDQTLGRAIRSLTPLLDKDHEVILKLRSMVKESLPESADDFEKKKWFEKKNG